MLAHPNTRPAPVASPTAAGRLHFLCHPFANHSIFSMSSSPLTSWRWLGDARMPAGQL